MQNARAVNTDTAAVTVKPRLEWVECARVLATLSVIMQHSPGGGAPFNQWLIGPSLALFFLLAGYFSATQLFAEGGFQRLGKRLKFLALPYLFWNFLYWALSGFTWAGMSTLQSVLGAGTCPILTPMWFLRDLMIFTVAAFLLGRCRALLYGVGLFCLFLYRWDDSLAWPAPDAFGYFVLGILLGSSLPGILERYGKMPLMAHAGILLAAASLVRAHGAETCLKLNGGFGPLVMAGLLSFGIVLKGAAPVMAQRLARLASGSFFVYCGHIFIVICLLGVEMCFSAPWPRPVWWAMVPVIYLLTWGVYELLKRGAPRFLAIIGGR